MKVKNIHLQPANKNSNKCHSGGYLENMWNSLQELQQLGVAIVRDAALLGKVVVVRRNELAHGHDARWLALQQVNYLTAELNELRVTNRTLAALNPWLCRICLFKKN